MAAILNITDELMADSIMFDIVDEVIPQFAEAIGNMEDRWITNGTGVGQPTGYITAAPPGVACIGGGITFLDIKNVFYALPAQYRMNSVWQIHNQNVRKIASIRDTVGRFIYHEDVTGSSPSTLTTSVLQRFKRFARKCSELLENLNKKIETISSQAKTVMSWKVQSIRLRPVLGQ